MMAKSITPLTDANLTAAKPKFFLNAITALNSKDVNRVACNLKPSWPNEHDTEPEAFLAELK